jgi:hypothetical protein
VNTVELVDSELKVWIWVDVPAKLIVSPSAATAGGRATRAFFTVIVNVTASLIRVCPSERTAVTVGSEAFCRAMTGRAKMQRATTAKSIWRAALCRRSRDLPNRVKIALTPVVEDENEFELEKFADK